MIFLRKYMASNKKIVEIKIVDVIVLGEEINS